MDKEHVNPPKDLGEGVPDVAAHVIEPRWDLTPGECGPNRQIPVVLGVDVIQFDHLHTRGECLGAAAAGDHGHRIALCAEQLGVLADDPLHPTNHG